MEIRICLYRYRLRFQYVFNSFHQNTCYFTSFIRSLLVIWTHYTFEQTTKYLESYEYNNLYADDEQARGEGRGSSNSLLQWVANYCPFWMARSPALAKGIKHTNDFAYRDIHTHTDWGMLGTTLKWMNPAKSNKPLKLHFSFLFFFWITSLSSSLDIPPSFISPSLPFIPSLSVSQSRSHLSVSFSAPSNSQQQWMGCKGQIFNVA